MNVSIIEDHTAVLGVVGLGYVGFPLAVEAARSGYRTLGVDAAAALLDGVNLRESHVQDVPRDVVAAFTAEGLDKGLNTALAWYRGRLTPDDENAAGGPRTHDGSNFVG